MENGDIHTAIETASAKARKRYRKLIDLQSEMQSKGYHLTDTGGNCTAYANEDESILITKQTDPEAPEALTDPVTIGYYTPEFERSESFDTLETFLKGHTAPTKG